MTTNKTLLKKQVYKMMVTHLIRFPYGVYDLDDNRIAVCEKSVDAEAIVEALNNFKVGEL